MNAWKARGPVLAAGLGGALLIAAAPSTIEGGLSLFRGPSANGQFHGSDWALAVAPVVAVGLSLLLLRWWPYLLVVAGLSTGALLAGTTDGHFVIPLLLHDVAQATAVVGVLACAQGLLRDGATGAGAAMAGLALGSRLFGSVLAGGAWLGYGQSYGHWRYGLAGAGLATVLVALPRIRLAGPATTGPVSWSRLRLVVAGALAVALTVPLSLLSTRDVAALTGVGVSALVRHPYAEAAILGAVALALAAGLAALAGLWSLGGALTAATVQAAVSAPLLLAAVALNADLPLRWAGAAAGVAAGMLAVASRWRVAAAGTLTVVAATSLFIAYAATTGHPERLAEQYRVVPGLVILVLVVAAGTAVTGAAAPALAPRGAVPAVLGPLAGVLAASGLQTLGATYVEADGLPVSSYLNPVRHLNTSGVLLLVAGAAVGGLGLAHYLAERWAERKRAEQIRREAAEAERDRLARPIHDGVLQVLAMVQRQDAGSPLAELAGEQEVALRRLLTGGGTLAPGAGTDVRAALTGLATPTVEVAAPAEAVSLPPSDARELVAAVGAALDNVRRHAGPGARAWILLEDEGDGVRVTVRDDGAGIPAGRLAEAERDGRLGVTQSMRGRIRDLNGTMTIDSRPGEGTEVEFWVPRAGR